MIELERIDFKNGSSGKTPLNKTNLNKLQDNMQKAINNVEEEQNTLREDGDLVKKINISGASIQEGTLSIESEAPIKSVGDNINLLGIQDGSWNTNGLTVNVKDNVININGTSAADSNVFFTLQEALNLNGQYSFQAGNDVALSSGEYFRLYTGTTGFEVLKSFGALTYLNVKSENINISGKADRLAIRVNAGTVFNNVTFKPKLETGTKATPYSPYGQGSIEIKQSAKNLANYTDEVTSSSIVNFDIGDIVSGKDYTVYIDLNGTLSFNLKYKTTGTIIRTSWNMKGIHVYNFTATETDILHFNGFSGNGYTGAKVMLLEGTYTTETIPPYEKYQGQTKALYTQQPFRAIGYYKDKFVKKLGKWNEEHKIREIPLANRSGWLSGNNYFALPIGGLNYGTYDDKISPVLSSTHFKYVSGKPVNNLQEGEMWYQTLSDNLSFKYIYFGVDKTKDYASTLEKFEEWLLNNNVLLNYVLGTPTLIECTPEQVEVLNDIYSAYGEGMTNIICNDEVEPVIEIVKETKETVQSENDKAISALIARVEELEKLVSVMQSTTSEEGS